MKRAALIGVWLRERFAGWVEAIRALACAYCRNPSSPLAAHDGFRDKKRVQDALFICSTHPTILNQSAMRAPLIANHLILKRSCVPLRHGKGVGRSGPCNPGGVSPSLHNDFSCITGSIFTGPGHPHQREMQNGFLEPISRWWGVPASSGPIQSLDKTKAHLSASFPVFHPFVSRLMEQVP